MKRLGIDPQIKSAHCELWISRSGSRVSNSKIPNRRVEVELCLLGSNRSRYSLNPELELFYFHTVKLEALIVYN